MFSLFKKKSSDPQGFLKDEDEPKFIEDVEAEEKRRKTATSAHQTRQQVVDYLSTREGVVISAPEMAEDLGMSEGYAGQLLSKLSKRGTIKRHGKRGHYSYTVRHKRVYKKRTASAKVKKTRKWREPQVPEVHTKAGEAERKVYDSISRHEDELMTQADVARGSGTAYSKVSYIVRKLEEDKAIVRSLPTHSGTKYWLAESVTGGPNPTALAAKPTNYNAMMCSRTEELVWQFLMEQRETDILRFLGWLKQRK